MRYQEARKVTIIGSIVDLLLGVAKVVIGYTAHSQALIADGVHSLSDLVTDVMVLFAAKHASKGADEDHPYGHARIETVMTVILGTVLTFVAIGIAYEAIERMFHPEQLLKPSWPALLVAGISILSKEGIYHYTMNAARRLRSNLLRANAWHSRSDAISSVIVVVGVAGTMAGLDYLDAVAAVGVAVMIARIGWDLVWNSLRELVDTGLDADQIETIKQTINGVQGVRGLHFLRSRHMGPDALVDVHIQVEPRLSVSEGHQVSETVRQAVIDSVDDVTDVLVHIDPENDELGPPCDGLPMRNDLLLQLQQRWQDIEGADKIDDVTLHYLHGQIHIDIQIPLAAVKDITQARQITSQISQAVKEINPVGEVQINFFDRPNMVQK